MWTSSRMITYFTFSKTWDAWEYRVVRWTRWRWSRWSEKILYGNDFRWRNGVGRTLDRGNFQKILYLRVGRMWMQASTVTCVSEENFCLLLARNIPNSGYLSWTDPTVAPLRAWHCPVSGGGRPGHPERGWYPSKSLPASPNKGLLGRSKQDVYRGGSVASSEAQLKRIIAIALKKIAPEVPPTMMRGVSLHVRSANRNGLMPMVHRMAWGTQSPNISVLKIWWRSVKI